MGIPALSKEDRNIIDGVGRILTALQELRAKPEVSHSMLDDASVKLRKLLMDGGDGHYADAWSLLGLANEPKVHASDLDGLLQQSGMDQHSIIWIEAPLAQAKPKGWEVVTDTSKFIPPHLDNPQLVSTRIGSFMCFEVISADGHLYIWGYQPQTGMIIATKFEPVIGVADMGAHVRRLQADLRKKTSLMGAKCERDFSLTDLRDSAAVVTPTERLTRNSAIGFLANRRGAHIDPAVKVNLPQLRDQRREGQYSGLRSIPSWADQLQTVFGQVYSIACSIASSPDTETYLEQWSKLPAAPRYDNP